VNVLFGALLVVVAGSLAGQYFAIHQRLPLGLSFWLGTQGYEYVDLGRAWQIALFTGLVLWLGLMLRALWPALRRRDESRTLVLMFTGAATAIGLMYGAGFAFSARTHLSVMEYWRWWVVHLWVEGFFEVFATAALALVFAKLGLVAKRHAGLAVIASSALFLFAGIPGTFHHLYWSGTPDADPGRRRELQRARGGPADPDRARGLPHQPPAAGGAVDGEVPLADPLLRGHGVLELPGRGRLRLPDQPADRALLHAGLNTTPVHAHTALFGVYGLLSLGLVLLVARTLTGERAWKETPLAVAFWSMNIGLGLMVALSLLPVGIAQTIASAETGLWYARSAEFLQQPWLQRCAGCGCRGQPVPDRRGAFAWFMAGSGAGWSYEPSGEPVASGSALRSACRRPDAQIGTGSCGAARPRSSFFVDDATGSSPPRRAGPTGSARDRRESAAADARCSPRA
jgi:nitric oxide reductase subunit B